MFGRTSRQWTLVFLLLASSAHVYAQVTAPAAYASSINKNYVRVWEATAPMQDPNTLLTAPLKDVKESTQYFDGLGRPLQTVSKKGSLITDPASPASSANAVDMVAPVVYDEFGREQYKYLPFAANSTGSNTSISDGLFKLNPFQQQAAFAAAQYPGEAYYYGKTNFENSPLNRMNDVYGSGDSWVGSESNSNASLRKNVATQYSFNDVSDSVRIWTVSGGSFSTSARYAAGQLDKLVTIDEHKNSIVEYKDKEGQVILKKVQMSASPSTGHYGWICTYYVYDDNNLLRGVFQPIAVEEMLATSWAVTATILNELTFCYEYDEKNRLIKKKVPGVGEVRMVYDKWDRPVLIQDANLRVNHKWLFTKYDQLNRPVMTGFYTNSTDTTQATMQAYLDAQDLGRYESYQTATFPLYSLTQSFPSVSFSDVLTITYYDDYSWAGWYGSYSSKDNTWDSEFTSPDGNWPYRQSLAQSSQTRGLVTGVWDNTGPGLLTATYYDDKGRAIQTKTYNYTTGVDVATTQYSFNGQVLQTVLRHQKSGTNSQTHLVQTRVSYDEMDRVIKTERKLNSTIGSTNLSEGWHTTATIEYDALGLIKKKTLAPSYASSGLDTLTNTYNIRGWLTAINKGYITGTSDAWFGMELGYDRDGYASFAAKQYNGNICATIWRTRGDGVKRKYEFGYDPLNRLLKADFTQENGSGWNLNDGLDFSMKMGDGIDGSTAYDANGNIKKMWQRGWKVGGSVTIDSLIYSYNSLSNRLKFVRDGMNDPTTRLSDFHESATNNSGNQSGTADYNYDVNGNMTEDANKSISSITYNHLNLPSAITVTGKGTIEYLYDNTGNKIKKVLTESGQVKTTLYVAGFVYENDTLQLLLHEEGRVRLTTNSSNAYNGYAFDYFEKDHLGNVRVLLTEQRDTAAYPEASMETGNLARDTLYYSKILTTRILRSGVTAYPTNVGYTSPDDYVAETNGSGNKIGPGIVLKVMSGDKINIRVSSWYRLNGASPQAPNSPIADLVGALISGFGGVQGSKATSSELSTNGVLSPGILNYYGTHNSADSTTKPKAFLNWVLFDEQFQFVSSSSGFEQVGSDQEFKIHTQSNLPVNKSGYLYIYVSNETPNVSVFFDNLQVTHVKGPLLEETHYYPFGLTMFGVSSKAIKNNYLENRCKFNNGTELSNREFSDGSGLEWYETTFRSYDPQIGRFHQVDLLADLAQDWTPYNYALNNPISYNDPLGLAAETDSTKKPNTNDVPLMPEVIVTAQKRNCQTCQRGPVVNVGAPPASSGIFVGPSTRGKSGPTRPSPSQQAQQAMVSLVGYDPSDPMEVLKNAVEEEPTTWGRIWNGPFYRGKNIFGDKLFQPYYGGPAPDVSGGMALGKATMFVNISKRIRAASTINFAIGISSARFEAVLAKVAGKAWEATADGKAKILLHNGLKYVSRVTSKSGSPTIEIFRDGQLLQKYRLTY